MPLPALNDLSTMNREALSGAWREITNSAPPPKMSQVFMRRVLGFEIQARRSGGLPKALLKELGKSPAIKNGTRSTPILKPGGRLLREWNGVTHVVEVTDSGFSWNGETWRSLSSIARAITGAHWSGPRFFGLNKGKS